MKTHYNKLVRDKIPEIIESEGRNCKTRILTQSEYRKQLLLKLHEEAEEVSQAGLADLNKEIADLYEVIDALITEFALDPHAIKEMQLQRRESRGGFEKQLMLVWAE